METIKIKAVNKKSYYVFFDVDTQTFDVIDCTNHDIQPIIKSFKYETSAYNFHNKLIAEKFNLK